VAHATVIVDEQIEIGRDGDEGKDCRGAPLRARHNLPSDRDGPQRMPYR
jgi:hypothetical protein